MSRLLTTFISYALIAILFPLLAQGTTSNPNAFRVFINGVIEDAEDGSEITFKFYKDYITFEEENFTTSIKKGSFTISFSLDEPSPGFVVYDGETIPIFLEDGDELSLHSHHTAFVDSLQFANKGALRNNYLKESFQQFDKKDASLIKDGMTQNTVEDFVVFLEQYRAEKQSFVSNYLSINDTTFSASFQEYVQADIQYWWGQNMLTYKDNHPASHLLPVSLTLPEEFYDFVETLELNNEDALNNANYLKYLEHYTEWRQDRIERGLLKIQGDPPIRQRTASVSSIEKFAKVKMRSLEVRERAHDQNSVIAKLKQKDQVLYLRDKTSDRFRYVYDGRVYIDYFCKVQLPDGRAGWVFNMGIDIIEDVITKNVQVDLPKESDELLKNVKYASFKGKVLHYAITKDIYTDIQNGKRVRKSVLDKYISSSPYGEFVQLITEAYANRRYVGNVSRKSLRGTSAKKEELTEEIAKFTKNLISLIEIASGDQKNVKPTNTVKDKLSEEPEEVVAKEEIVVVEKKVEEPVAESAPAITLKAPEKSRVLPTYTTITDPDFTNFEQSTAVRFKTNFSSADKPVVHFYQNPFERRGKEHKLGKFTSGNSFVAIHTKLYSESTWDLVNGEDAVRLFFEPGDDIKVEIKGSDIYTQTLFTGNGSENNQYLLKAADKFKKNHEELLINIEDLDIQEFKDWLGTVRQEKLNFLYANLEGLSESFYAYAEADVNYWYAFHLMDYLYQHPLANDETYPMQASEGYLDFMSTIPVNNESALSNRYYLDYIQEYIIHQEKQATNNGLSRYQLANIYLTGNTKDFYISRLLITELARQELPAGINKRILTYLNTTPNSIYTEFVKEAYHEKMGRGLFANSFAPNFQLLNDKGHLVGLEQYKGKVVIINFWATWCETCLRIKPSFKNLKDRFKDKEVAFVYISLDNNSALWKNYLRTNPVFGEQLLAGESLGFKAPVAKDYKIIALPYTLLLDGNGKIIWQDNGGFSFTNLGNRIERLLSLE